MKITILKKPQKSDLKDIQELMNQLSSDPSKYPPIRLKLIQAISEDKNTVIVVAKDGKRIIGMGSLGVFPTLRGLSGYIDNVVVHSEYRGQGLGEQISAEMLKIGKKKKLYRIDLTSSPKRVAANALYQKLGFELRETNAYTIKP